jgi:hypothetical protein
MSLYPDYYSLLKNPGAGDDTVHGAGKTLEITGIPF